MVNETKKGIPFEWFKCTCGAMYAATYITLDPDWVKEKRKAVKKGHTVHQYESGFKLSSCTCKKKTKKRGHLGTDNTNLKSNIRIEINFPEYPAPLKFEPTEEDKKRVLAKVNALFSKDFHKTKYLTFND